MSKRLAVWERRGEGSTLHYVRMGAAYRAKDGTLTVYLDAVPVGETLIVAPQGVNPFERELRRLAEICDTEATLPDGSSPDTTAAHALLGDFDEDDAVLTMGGR